MDCDDYMECNNYLDTLVGESCTICRRRRVPGPYAAHIAEMDAVALSDELAGGGVAQGSRRPILKL